MHKAEGGVGVHKATSEWSTFSGSAEETISFFLPKNKRAVGEGESRFQYKK